jgi:hypothetical protein
VRSPSGEEDVTMVAMFPVHEIFAALYNAGWDQFSKSCFGDYGQEVIHHFWEHTKHMHWNSTHPARQNPACIDYTIPCSFFGDEGRLYKGEKMMVLEMSLFFSRASTIHTKFILCAIPHWLLVKG